MLDISTQHRHQSREIANSNLLTLQDYIRPGPPQGKLSLIPHAPPQKHGLDMDNRLRRCTFGADEAWFGFTNTMWTNMIVKTGTNSGIEWPSESSCVRGWLIESTLLFLSPQNDDWKERDAFDCGNHPGAIHTSMHWLAMHFPLWTAWILQVRLLVVGRWKRRSANSWPQALQLLDSPMMADTKNFFRGNSVSYPWTETAIPLKHARPTGRAVACGQSFLTSASPVRNGMTLRFKPEM